MEMAGLKPHHPIAMGVSGGADSMALCILTSDWKTRGLNGTNKSGSFIDGLLGIVVDHGLRSESKDEAEVVSRRVSEMGIRCEIACCDWVDGKPKQGHLQEAAREMRYQMLQKVCFQHQIGVLLIAHHADDQAESFILRLSRHSGVLGLASMAFTSEIFSSEMHYSDENFNSRSILLVRPLLHFWKEDMYKICRWADQDWVEDPTNQSPLFARNRIRMSIGKLSSSIFRSELQAVISACRKTRSFVDQVCHDLIKQTVTVMDQQGYAVLDLQNLNPSEVPDICLSNFIARVLQFISQRQRPVRGNASKLLLSYIRTIPCESSLTAAGCYLCPAPGSKGTKALVCCSVDCPLPSNTEVFCIHSVVDKKHQIPYHLGQIIADGKSFSDHLVPEASAVPFLDMKSESVLTEARRLNLLSDSTHKCILLLKTEEAKRFKSKTGKSECESGNEVQNVSTSHCKTIRLGEACYFMNRFLIDWKLRNHREANCGSCVASPDMLVEVRHMVESDWLRLAHLSNCTSTDSSCSDYLRLSAQRALLSLKSIPAAARKSLPVMVNDHGVLLSIPTIDFRHCPCLETSAVFRPRVPLGGGHSSFV